MTRLVRPPDPFISNLILTRTTRHLNSITSTSADGNFSRSSAPPRRISYTTPKQFPSYCSSAAGPRRPNSGPPTMDLNPSPNGELVQDFVTVQNPANGSPNPDSFDAESDSAEGGDDGTGDSEGGEGERRVLPEGLSSGVVVLSCENVDGEICDVYLVGTAHVSQESCRLVQAVINAIKPEVVFLELCSSRVAILTLRDLKVPTMNEMIDMWKKKQNLFGIIYSWFLAKVANKLEVLPGSEFRAAFDAARKFGSKVILGDRPVQVTLRRTWGKMPLWHKMKLLYAFLFQAFFLPSPEELNRMLKEMDDVDMLTLVVQEMSKVFPTLTETLVDERDRYMSSTLLRVASQHSSVVAVVGKGHLQGLKKHWMQPVELNELLEVPSGSATSTSMRILKSAGIAVAGLAIISGIYLAVKKQP